MLPLAPPVEYNINNWFMVLDDDHLNPAQKSPLWLLTIIMNQKLRLFSRDRRVNISIMLVTLFLELNMLFFVASFFFWPKGIA